MESLSDQAQEHVLPLQAVSPGELADVGLDFMVAGVDWNEMESTVTFLNEHFVEGRAGKNTECEMGYVKRCVEDLDEQKLRLAIKSVKDDMNLLANHLTCWMRQTMETTFKVVGRFQTDDKNAKNAIAHLAADVALAGKSIGSFRAELDILKVDVSHLDEDLAVVSQLSRKLGDGVDGREDDARKLVQHVELQIATHNAVFAEDFNILKDEFIRNRNDIEALKRKCSGYYESDVKMEGECALPEGVCRHKGQQIGCENQTPFASIALALQEEFLGHVEAIKTSIRSEFDGYLDAMRSLLHSELDAREMSLNSRIQAAQKGCLMHEMLALRIGDVEEIVLGSQACLTEDHAKLSTPRVVQRTTPRWTTRQRTCVNSEIFTPLSAERASTGSIHKTSNTCRNVAVGNVSRNLKVPVPPRRRLSHPPPRLDTSSVDISPCSDRANVQIQQTCSRDGSLVLRDITEPRCEEIGSFQQSFNVGSVDASCWPSLSSKQPRRQSREPCRDNQQNVNDWGPRLGSVTRRDGEIVNLLASRHSPRESRLHPHSILH